MRRLSLMALALSLAALACAGSPSPAQQSPLSLSMAATARSFPPGIELFFRGERPFARRYCPGPRCEEWSLGEVTKSEMIFSPDKKRFAYVRDPAVAQAGRSTPAASRVLVRNLAGDPVNEFAVYRPGRPGDLVWLDDRRIGYLAPPDPRARATNVYVVHDADTGEILAARSGSDFTFSPSRRRVAFVSGTGARQTLIVDGQTVWPRGGVTHLHGEPVWSGDEHGLAFIDEGPRGARLVVLVEIDDPHGDLTWPIPAEALGPGLHIFWSSDSKVVIGESPLKPKFAAGWERLQ